MATQAELAAAVKSADDQGRLQTISYTFYENYLATDGNVDAAVQILLDKSDDYYSTVVMDAEAVPNEERAGNALSVRGGSLAGLDEADPARGFHFAQDLASGVSVQDCAESLFDLEDTEDVIIPNAAEPSATADGAAVYSHTSTIALIKVGVTLSDEIIVNADILGFELERSGAWIES
ncbi:hypothetical protein [Microbacterium sp. NPDC076911]|uniref:hypothetical protein n=1 Tax=Microbacterium sp. NPDC076911 TaxID=3154958 RepID=UPI00344A3E89